MKVSVLGTGYVGLTHAACLAAAGHEVVAYDIDRDRVACLRSGRVPVREPGLDDLVREGVGNGHLLFTDRSEPIADCDVHFICVGTPQRPGGYEADLSAVWAAADLLAGCVERPGLVVGKSTVPVGTAAALARRLDERGRTGFGVAWNPEFLREGHAVQDSRRPERIVVGVQDDAAYALLVDLYAQPMADGVPIIRTDLQTAELAKVSANVMLASRISMINLLAEVCEHAGADIEDLVRILGADSRIGPEFLRPGAGYGGSCLPKDTRAYIARAHRLGVHEPIALLHHVDVVNMRQRARTIDAALRLIGGVGRVAILGAAFKNGSDDVRDSPALDIAATLGSMGVDVRVYDPAALEAARAACPQLGYADDVDTACAGADLVLVLTDWAEFAGIDPVALSRAVRTPTVLDARLVLDADKWQAAGWAFHRLGTDARRGTETAVSTSCAS